MVRGGVGVARYAAPGACSPHTTPHVPKPCSHALVSLLLSWATKCCSSTAPVGGHQSSRTCDLACWLGAAGWTAGVVARGSCVSHYRVWLCFGAQGYRGSGQRMRSVKRGTLTSGTVVGCGCPVQDAGVCRRLRPGIRFGDSWRDLMQQLKVCSAAADGATDGVGRVAQTYAGLWRTRLQERGRRRPPF